MSRYKFCVHPAGYLINSAPSLRLHLTHGVELNLKDKLTIENLAAQGRGNVSGKATDAVKAELKIVKEKYEKPKITLTLAREKEKSVNFGIVNAEMVNLNVIKRFDCVISPTSNSFARLTIISCKSRLNFNNSKYGSPFKSSI